tara:strand:+ start:291 stop:455 length:165 start_codon:yes stop_codon:yes gene_type:complete
MFISYAILPIGIALSILGTFLIYKTSEDNNAKLLGAAWLFFGAMLITFYLKSIL